MSETNNDNTKACSRCQKIAPLSKCAACKMVEYCSVACQRDDWKTHKIVCRKDPTAEQQQELRYHCGHDDVPDERVYDGMVVLGFLGIVDSKESWNLFSDACSIFSETAKTEKERQRFRLTKTTMEVVVRIREILGLPTFFPVFRTTDGIYSPLVTVVDRKTERKMTKLLAEFEFRFEDELGTMHWKYGETKDGYRKGINATAVATKEVQDVFPCVAKGLTIFRAYTGTRICDVAVVPPEKKSQRGRCFCISLCNMVPKLDLVDIAEYRRKVGQGVERGFEKELEPYAEKGDVASTTTTPSNFTGTHVDELFVKYYGWSIPELLGWSRTHGFHNLHVRYTWGDMARKADFLSTLGFDQLVDCSIPAHVSLKERFDEFRRKPDNQKNISLPVSRKSFVK
jgi:hypothetical protein